MRGQLYISLLLTFCSIVSTACLSAYQFKIFPVGVDNDKIITIDFKVRRTMQVEAKRTYSLNLDEKNKFSVFWILKAYISVYDKNQKLISSKAFDTAFAQGYNYSDTLQKIYNSGLEKILKENTNIELFTPEYISYCDFQKKCNVVSLLYDSIAHKDHLLFKNKKYPIDIIRDTSYYGLGDENYSYNNTLYLYTSSVRILKTKAIKLVLTHLATGDEIDRMTSDPKQVKETEDGPITLSKEYKPRFSFTNIKTSTYIEPLLHHGYGFDVFIIQ